MPLPSCAWKAWGESGMVLSAMPYRGWSVVLAGLLACLAAGSCRTPSPPADEGTRQLGGGTVSATPPGEPPKEVRSMLASISPAILEENVYRLARFGTRHTLSDISSMERGIGAARRWIKSQFDRFSKESGRSGETALRTYFDEYLQRPDGDRINRPVTIANVVAELPGRMPEARGRRYYVIGHYDSRASDPMDSQSDAPGSNDDASGVSVVMELARTMSRYEYDSTIIFMATAGEEQGLYGAWHHARTAREKGIDIRAVLSNDIVGDPSAVSGPPQNSRVRLFSEGLPASAGNKEMAEILGLSGESDSPSRQLARAIDEVAAWHFLSVQPMLVFRQDRVLRGGDHSAFNEFGYAAVRFTVVEENYHRQHQDIREENGVRYGDRPEYVDGEYMAGVARINAAALAHLANAPSAPGRTRIIVAELTNDTTLRWSPSPEPDVAGYEIVWRETTTSTWQQVHDAGKVTEITLPMSKDNYFFGVRAYDAGGYRSPVSFPRAADE